MNKFVFVGKIVKFHGLDGKVKVISEINLKEKVFKVGNFLYMGDEKIKLEINSYQKNQKYEFISFTNYLDINLITNFINQRLYVDISNLNLSESEYLESELLRAQVWENNQNLGEVTEILQGKKYNYVKVKGKKEFLIPLIGEFIISYKRDEEKLLVKNAVDLII